MRRVRRNLPGQLTRHIHQPVFRYYLRSHARAWSALMKLPVNVIS
jgi:hypothetical protein